MAKGEAEQRFKSLGTVSKRFTVPMLLWEEWEKDCNERFGGTYASKMQHDHEYHKSMSALTTLVAQDMVLMNERIMGLTLELEALREEIISKQGESIQETKKSSDAPAEELETPKKRAATF